MQWEVLWWWWQSVRRSNLYNLRCVVGTEGCLIFLRGVIMKGWMVLQQ